MGRPRTFDRDQVLEDAVQLFREKGFEGTSVPNLVDRLGICRQSLYSEFGDKRALYLAALERWGQREIEAKISLLESEGSPLENLRTVVRGWADQAARCPSEGCLTAKAIIECHDAPDALAVVESQVTSLEKAFCDNLMRAKAEGELIESADPKRLSHTLIMGAYGIGVLARLPSSSARIRDGVSVLLAMIDDVAA